MRLLEIQEESVILKTKRELIEYMFEGLLFKREMCCKGSCSSPMKLEECKQYVDGFVWRCYTRRCTSYQKRRSIRDESFFEGFNTPLKTLLKTLFRYVSGQQQTSILKTIDICQPTYNKLVKKLIILMKTSNDNGRKLGGFGTEIQVDETMLNFKCKSHRGRSASNRTDAICIVEVINGSINKVWAEVIINKSIKTIMPIICDRVVVGSTIYTDEHRTYFALPRFGFLHQSVCHKYNFIHPVSGVHTQHVESFNNVLKIEIKKRKGVLTCERSEFLSEMVWKWNNKKDLLENLINIIKV